MLWVTRQRAMVVMCDPRSEVKECGCRWRAKKDEQICEVRESTVPNCRRSRQVLELGGC